MDAYLEQIKEQSLLILERHNKKLYSIVKVKEYGLDIIRISIEDPVNLNIDIDEIALINQEILDLTNDLLPDDTYLEVSSVGIERELQNDVELQNAINEYVYVSCYTKIDSLGEKELYGYLNSFTESSITILATIKTREKLITIDKSNIAKIRLAVKF